MKKINLNINEDILRILEKNNLTSKVNLLLNDDGFLDYLETIKIKHKYESNFHYFKNNLKIDYEKKLSNFF